MGNEYIDLKGMLALELPNLTRRLPTLRKMAQEQGWPYRKRQGRGGGVEYQVAGLPEEIQTAVRERQAEQLLAQSQPAVLPSVAKAKRPVAVRRMEQLGLPIDDYAMGLAALAPRPTKTETPVVQIAWLADFMAHHCRPSAPKLAHSYQEFAKDWLAAQPAYELPSLDTVRRVWKKLPQIMQQRGRMTGAAYKSLQPYIRRDWQALRPNDVWIGDGHSFKAKVQHPIHGQPFKPEVTVIIDGCTRMVVGFSFSLAESCVAVADALRIGIKHNGVPLMYYSDNGGGQTGKTIDHEITGLTARLGIHHETGLPGNPQGRGIIERWWQDNLIRLAAQYETFTGSSMDRSTQNLLYRKMDSAFNAWRQGKELTPEQQRYKAKLPSWQQFMADVMQCITDYNNRPHSELPKHEDGRHYTPIEYRDLRMQQENLAPDLLAEAELDVLFRPQEVRNGLSQSAVARAVGVTSPVVNQYLHGKYPGNVQEIERKIAAYLQKQREREAERKLEVDYVLTTTAKRVRDVLRLAHVEGEAVVLFGQAGLGKTSSLREYCKQAPDALMIETDPTYTAKVLLQKLAAMLGAGISAAAAGHQCLPAARHPLRAANTPRNSAHASGLQPLGTLRHAVATRTGAGGGSQPSKHPPPE